MYQKVKQRTYEILELAPPGDLASRIFDIFIMTLIFLNLIAVALETVESFWLQYHVYLEYFELFSVIVFTIEYVLRIWSCTVVEDFQAPVKGRIKFILTPLALIDLLAILPFYLPLLISDLRFVRSLRLFRLLRILKLGRYNESLKTLGYVIKSKKEDLIVIFSTVLILLFLASSMIYFVEHDAQPEAFPSIPESMWWGVITLTTVGYGDVYPVTLLGKLMAAMLAILGIGLFALPAGILASGFAEEVEARRIIKIQPLAKNCPHCGKEIHEDG